MRPEETLGRALFDLGERQWDAPALREMLEAVRVQDRAFDDLVVERDFPRIGRRRVVLNARRILGRSGKDQLVLLAVAAARDGGSGTA